jgi:hypothetical protein
MATPTATQKAACEDPVIEAYKRGLDVTLLRENLRRSADERMRNLVALQALAAALHEAGRRARGDA